MRNFFFFVILAVGAGIGLFSALHENWGTRLGMMALGGVIAVPIGSVLTGMGRGRKRSRRRWSSGGPTTTSGSLFKGDAPIRRWDR